MNKKFLIDLGILAAVIIAAFGFWYYQKIRNAARIETIQQAGNTADDLSKNVSQGVLPSIDPKVNLSKNVSNINPISKTNPFSNVKTNPFK